MTTRTPAEIQHLVDEHAYLGMSNERISQHLRQSHGVSESDPIPAPSPTAAKARDRYLRTGVIETMPGSKSTVIRIGPSFDSVGKKSKPRQDIPLRTGVKATHEESVSFFNAGLAAKGISPIKVDMYEEDEEAKAKRRFDDMLMHEYVAHGPTLLDRIVRGYANLQRELNQASSEESDLLIIKKSLQRKHAEGLFKHIPVRDLEDLEGGVFELRDMGLWPWFDGVSKTENIQISLEMAERFRSTPSSPDFDGHWETSFLDHPIYIDITGANKGDRHISGVFCRPITRGETKTFEYMAIVEWAGVAYEAILCGEYNHDVFWPEFFSTEDPPPDEIITEMYDPLMQSLIRLIPAAWVYYQSQRQDQNRQIGQITPESERGLKPKKQKAREKTHSYFKVYVPRNMVSGTGHGGKRWTLNHMITVSGHYRWQPYGPGRSRLKLIWIDPYDKGRGEDRRDEPRPLLTQVEA